MPSANGMDPMAWKSLRSHALYAGNPCFSAAGLRDEWEKEVKPILIKAFFNWAHTECLKS
jgi:hypothetical protein